MLQTSFSPIVEELEKRALMSGGSANLTLPASVAANVNTYGITAGTDITDSLNTLFRSSTCPNALYFPNGTYTIHDTLLYPLTDSAGNHRYGGVKLFGQSESGVVIKLASGSFTNAQSRKAMFNYEAPGSADYYSTRISNLTFAADTNNAGADGVDFMATNQGGMDYVTITSNDPNNRGIALNPGYVGSFNGPFTVENITINGFAVGIATSGWTAGATFNHITINNLTGLGTLKADGSAEYASVGLQNSGNGIAVRDLKTNTTSPAVHNMGVMSLLDSTFINGSSSKAAIINDYSAFNSYVYGVIYSRNVTSTGYFEILQDVSPFNKSITGSSITESPLTQSYSTAFANQTGAVKLTIVDQPTPTIPAASQWVDVASYYQAGDNGDYSPAFQRAIDSGAVGVFSSVQLTLGSTVHIRNNVQYINLLSGYLNGTTGTLNSSGGACFQFDGGTADTVVFEELRTNYGITLGNAWIFQNNSSRQLILRHITQNSGVALYRNGSGAGKAWMTDICGQVQVSNGEWVWATGLNSETVGKPNMTNNGAYLSVVGFKNEQGDVVADTQGGGFTEILGGLLYTTASQGTTVPILRTTDSYASIAGVAEMPGWDGGPTYQVLIQETRSGVTNTLSPTNAGENWSNSGKAIPLYTALPLGVTAPLPTPVAPGGLAATAISSSQINLTWTDKSNNETGFKVERATDSGFTQNLTLVITTAANVTSYSNTGLAASTAYYYRIRATNGTGDSSNSNSANATTNPSDPIAGYTYCADENQSFTLPGTADVAYGANGSYFFKYAQTGTITFNNATFGDPIPGVAKKGYYKTMASVPAAPSGLLATAASASQINLAWTDNSNNETGIKIERATNSAFTQNLTLVTTTAANVTSYSNTGLTAGTTYYYRVRATNAAGDSGNSNSATAQTISSVIANASFETFALASGGYQYNPTGGTWTFYGNSGLENNGSPFNAPSAPDGTQAAFLQGNPSQGSGSLGAIYQTINFSAGTYSLSFYAAQRNGQLQPIKVSVDGTQVGGTITPSSGSFAQYITASFTLAAGNHTLRLEATDNTGDKTSFIDKLALLTNRATGGTASASSNPSSGEVAQYAFDGQTSTKWLGTTTASGAWLQYQFGGGAAYAVKQYSITSANDQAPRDPKNWQLLASNDGVNWTTLDTQTNQSFTGRFVTNTYTISNTTAYKYYRLNVTDNNGSAETQLGGTGLLQLAELQLLA